SLWRRRHAKRPTGPATIRLPSLVSSRAAASNRTFLTKSYNLIIPHLQPWAKARMEATDGVADDTGQVCLPDGIFRYPRMAGRFLWLQERGRIVMVFGLVNTAGVRRIYLDRPHPKNPLPTWNGHSTGRWEEDTFAIDTVGFNDKSWLFGGMEPHTEEAHLI